MKLKHIQKGKLKANKCAKHDTMVGCAMNIIESVIEPLHYPVRGVNGAKYYELEDAIIAILKAHKL